MRNGSSKPSFLPLTLSSYASFRMKASGEQYDDRIVEVHWDSTVSHWRMMRFRDDKPHGNHRGTVESVLESIMDGVEKDAVSFSLRSPTRLTRATAVSAFQRDSQRVEDAPRRSTAAATSTSPCVEVRTHRHIPVEQGIRSRDRRRNEAMTAHLVQFSEICFRQDGAR